MPKSIAQDSETCLKSLIESIEETKKKLLTQDEVKKANKDEKAHLKEEREDRKSVV